MIQDDTTEDEEEEEEEGAIHNQEVVYDRSLPGAHSYLGDDLQDVSGRTIHDEDSYLTLPLLALPGVVLTPGQTIPLHLFEPSVVSMVRHILTTDRTFGLLTARVNSDEPVIGTTAEILAVKDEEDDRSGVSVVRVKAIGRQRFQVLESRRQVDGMLMGKVLILPESQLCDALEGAVAPSLRRRGVTLRSTGKFNKLSSAYATSLPPWVYKQYDADDLMQRLRCELLSWNDHLDLRSIPEDASQFSFWLASNLPLDDGQKLRLLRLHCSVQRLRCELSLMQRCSALCCKNCALRIAEKKDVFCMADEGPIGAYVNPGGHVHETLTLYKAQGLTLIGRPSTENSWFPGYAWTILQCRNCMQHMGWKFNAVKGKLKPEKFWGLCRSSLIPGILEESEGTEEWRPSM
ncbi:hypothetical protein CAPTEDRAFT_173167 [Capitella teleta]|uniref:Protein cereblon n=1 Tax=Capitella teleta TaxID=283909 RepID=R7TQ36_CAPTE|nr:hypothetical protein CAPTEDRAFT_173167 [Capitella teleta]|eukprot:ELT95677.1 hypothetical protein CAPTEDRAFT_173167 [Capitella teleta]